MYRLDSNGSQTWRTSNDCNGESEQAETTCYGNDAQNSLLHDRWVATTDVYVKRWASTTAWGHSVPLPWLLMTVLQTKSLWDCLSKFQDITFEGTILMNSNYYPKVKRKRFLLNLWVFSWSYPVLPFQESMVQSRWITEFPEGSLHSWGYCFILASAFPGYSIYCQNHNLNLQFILLSYLCTLLALIRISQLDVSDL